MVKYETPKIDITYFDGLIGTTNIAMVSEPRTAAQNMNEAALMQNGPINAAAARTVRVQTILQFNTDN